MSSSALDGILAAGPEAIAREVAKVPETQWFERKSIRLQPSALAKALVGMANAEGGVVLVGVSEGQLQDVTSYPKVLNELRRVPTTFTSPPVRANYQQFPWLAADGTAGEILVVRVLPGTEPYELSDGACYLRVGDSTVKLTALQRDELLYDRGQAQFESRSVPDVTESELADWLLPGYKAAIGLRPGAPTEALLRARGLTSKSGELTVAAYLLFGEQPQQLFPSAYVRVLQYSATKRGVGGNQTLIAGRDQRHEGPIPEQISAAAKTIGQWLPEVHVLQPDGKFGPRSMIPEEVWLEGLVNAVVHRSYSNAGDHIRVELFPDRIEIQSPGRFPGLVDTAEPLKIARYARNPKIARVCGDLAITQELGEGIKRMFGQMRAVGLQDPAYRQTSGSVILTLPTAQRVSERVASQIGHGPARVIAVLRRAEAPMSTGQISEQLKVSRPTAIRYLKSLRDAGLVVGTSHTERDPTNTWTLADATEALL